MAYSTWELDPGFSSALQATVSLTSGRERRVGAGFDSSLSASVGLSVVRTRTIGASFASALVASVDLEGTGLRTRNVGASFASGLHGSFDLSVKKNQAIGAGFVSSLSASVNLTGASDTRAKTVGEIIRESLALWSIVCPKTAPKYALDRAITDLNTALQLVWNNAEGSDYWTNEVVTFTLDDGESSYELTNDIQSVIGPCRRSDTKRTLSPIKTIGELETFSTLYLDGESASEPLAYHVDRIKQSGVDPAKCVIRVTPEVQGDSISFDIDVVKEAPRYTIDDLSVQIPIPHRYAETLLIPIIRYSATSYFLFSSSDETQKKTIDEEYAQARRSLGIADPNPVKEPEGGKK